MPTYSTRCESCAKDASIRLSFVDYESVKLGAKSLECSECHGKVALAFDPGNIAFVLTDGESGGWASKSVKENKYRAAHRLVMGKREKDHVFKSRLIPNHEGMETGTWRDAQEVAREKGGNLAAETYAPLVKKEKAVLPSRASC